MKRKVARKKRPAGAKPAKPARAKPVRKRAPPSVRPRAPHTIRPERDFVDGLMAASAEALGVTIEPGWRKSVKFNLRLVLDHAARVEAFCLADDAEPAPVFHA